MCNNNFKQKSLQITVDWVTLYAQTSIYPLINPWRYSSEEPRPTEVVAARWQYRGPCGQQSAYPSTLISVFLTEFRYFSFKQLPNCPHEAGWTPFQTPYFKKHFQGIAGTSWMAVRRADHYTKQVVSIYPLRFIICTELIFVKKCDSGSFCKQRFKYFNIGEIGRS